MRSIDQKFYNSKEWKQCKNSYLSKVNHLCEICMEKGLTVPADIVHHKVHLNNENYTDASVSLNFENLQAVCMTCHNRIHFGAKEEPKRYRYVNGVLVIDTRNEQ